MPKESVHLIIAKKIYEQLIEDDFWKSLTAFKNEMCLGAIFQDTGTHTPDHIYKDEIITKYPQILHGAWGDDSLELLKTCLSNDCIKKDKQILAFIIGMTTHVFIDSTFHPMVYNLVGRHRGNGVVSNHRKIEYLIDLIIGEGFENIKKIQISCYIEQVPNLEEILKNIFRTTFPNNYHTYGNIWYESYLQYSKSREEITECFENIAYNKSLLEYESLLKDKINYKNPVSGENYSHTLNDLIIIAIQKTLNYCSLIKKYIVEDDEEIFEIIGPSLETNILRSDIKNMKYFQKPSFFEDEEQCLSSL